MTSMRIVTDLLWIAAIALACALMALAVLNMGRRLWVEARHRRARKPGRLCRPDMVMLWTHSPLNGDPGLPAEVLMVRCDKDLRNMGGIPFTYAVAIRGDGPLELWLGLTWTLHQIKGIQLETVHR
jgi:hypothetical protein